MIPLLQISFYETQTDMRSMLVMGGITFAVIIFLVIFNKLISRRSGNRHKRFSKRAFRREAASIGLSVAQTHLLEHYIKQYEVRSPFLLLNTPAVLGSVLKKAFRQLSGSHDNPASTEKLKLNLYRILQKVDIASRRQTLNQSTRKLRVGDDVRIKLNNNEAELESHIIANTQEYFVVENPYSNHTLREKRLRKGKKIILISFDGFSKKISFYTKIMGLSNTNNHNTILLQHIANATNAEIRIYKRRTLKSSCTFYLVNAIQERAGRKTVRKAIVASERGMVASMVDLSAGGCAFECTKSLSKGKLLKIAFKLPGGEPVEVFGKVISSSVNFRKKFIVNIQFTRASSKNLNKINNYCYDLG